MGYYDPPEYYESEIDYECENVIEVEVDTEEKWEVVPCGYVGIITVFASTKYGEATGECPKCGTEVTETSENPNDDYDPTRYWDN